MRRLGYERFGAHGGDLRGGVTARLGQRHPAKLIGIHVTNVYGGIDDGEVPPSAAERLYVAQQQDWDREEGGY
jgi:hypothetical protein